MSVRTTLWGLATGQAVRELHIVWELPDGCWLQPGCHPGPADQGAQRHRHRVWLAGVREGGQNTLWGGGVVSSKEQASSELSVWNNGVRSEAHTPVQATMQTLNRFIPWWGWELPSREPCVWKICLQSILLQVKSEANGVNNLPTLWRRKIMEKLSFI